MRDWFFIVKHSGMDPRKGLPATDDYIASVKEWLEGNPDADVLVVRLDGNDPAKASVATAREELTAYAAHGGRVVHAERDGKPDCGARGDTVSTTAPHCCTCVRCHRVAFTRLRRALKGADWSDLEALL